MLDQAQPTQYLTLPEIAKRFGPGRDGRPIHPSTVIRWITKGTKSQDGRVIKLEAKRLPGRWVVSDEAIDRFLDRLTSDRTGATEGHPLSPARPDRH